MFGFWLREALSNVARNRSMSLLAISTVAVSLFILGALVLTLANLQVAVAQQARGMELVLLLDKKVSPARRKALFQAARIPQVATVNFVSGSEALRKMGNEMNMPVDDLIDGNFLHDELHVTLKNPNDFFKVRSYLTSLKGIAGAQNADNDAATTRLISFNRFLQAATLVATLVLGLAILLIIHNAIRLTIFARRREIRIMRLVGATSAFVRGPFLLEGAFYGIGGASFALLILLGLYVFASHISAPIVQALLPLSPGDILGKSILGLETTGAFFGIWGAWWSFRHSQEHA